MSQKVSFLHIERDIDIMKIFIAANDSYGLYLFRRDLISRMIADGHKVFVSLPDGDCTERIKALGCTFYETEIDRRGINPLRDAKLILKYNSLLKKVRPDLIVTYTIKPNIYCGMAARWRHIPYAINITGLGTAFQKDGPLKTLVKGLYRAGCGKAKVVFTENPGIKEDLVSLKVFPENKIYVLHGAGVNTDYFKLAPYPKEEKPVKFLFIGRVMKEKGIDEFFSAAQRINAEGLSCEFHVAGDYEEDYHEKILKMQSEEKLYYHGFLDDIRPLIASCHCFVLPSYHEGMANTLLECGAMGRPLITSAIHGCREAVIENVSGYLVPPQDADGLYTAMKKFALLPQKEKAEMGLAAHSFVCKSFDKKQVVEATVRQLY